MVKMARFMFCFTTTYKKSECSTLRRPRRAGAASLTLPHFLDTHICTFPPVERHPAPSQGTRLPEDSGVG